MRLRACLVLFTVCLVFNLKGQIMISANENKIDLITGGPRVVPNPAPDNLTLLDFSSFPPKTQQIDRVENSVLGPPSNVAISPNGRLALIANSIRIPSPGATNWVPEDFVHLLDLAASPPAIVGKVKVEAQPSGISFTPDGRQALVANRAAGTISLLKIEGTRVVHEGSIKVCEPAEAVSDVAVSPDGRMALASVQKGGYLALLKVSAGHLNFTGRKISVSGQPYRCVITPDGQLGLVAGGGAGNARDLDALSIVDLSGATPQTIGYVPLGASPESIELSPDGKFLAAVVMDGSNLPAGDPNRTSHGQLVMLERRGKRFVETQRTPIVPIPEGVAFTGDGRYLVVQGHPDRVLQIFSVHRGRVKDTGHRIPVPGMPSALRAWVPSRR